MRETRAAWQATETAWAASPLAELELIPTVMAMVDEAASGSPAAHHGKLLVELAVATDQLLRAEDILPLELDWAVVEQDAAAALELRRMLERRRRWALQYDMQMNVFRRQLVGGYRDLIEAISEAGYDEAEGAVFTVPLSSMLHDPAAVIQRLLLCIYDDDVFRYDVFHKLRERYATNLVIASGFPPETNPHEVMARLVMPALHKSQNPTELAGLYLAGTPYEALFDMPVPFVVPDEVRFEHGHIVGGTGHGKTQLLQRMILADLEAAIEDGRSVVVVDSQGDLIQKLIRLELFQPDGPLGDRLVLIDPADVEYPPALNLFDARTERYADYRPADRERALNGLIELYETFFGALLGAELTQKQGVIFRYLARLMLAIPGATIHTLMQVMEDGRPYRAHMEALEGSARHFFATEFFHPSFAATKKQIVKRLWGVLSTPAFERMFAQQANKLDLFDAMNSGKIILISTAKDLLKTEGSALFGRFFIAMIAQAALERATLPEWRRTPTFVYVDEAQEYFDDTIETILSQARKYRVSICAAHQTLDQLSPRLRAAFLSNTSFKCAGGVSSRDARALASELHTTSEFIEGMRKRRDRTEFAVWVKGRTPEALRLDVPLGHLERQATLSEEDFEAMIHRTRAAYCGSLDDVLSFPVMAAPVPAGRRASEPRGEEAPLVAPEARDGPIPVPDSAEPIAEAVVSLSSPPEAPLRPASPAAPQRELGKGGPKHRYLQALVKELAEQQAFRVVIEAPLPSGPGQVDVLLERDQLRVAVEVSVTTPVEQERENLRKCLDAGFERVVVVLAKSRVAQGRYQTQLAEGLSVEERGRVAFLAPEDIPDYIAALAPPPAPKESIVKGYRVRVSHTAISPEEVQARRDRLAKVVARSLQQSGES